MSESEDPLRREAALAELAEKFKPRETASPTPPSNDRLRSEGVLAELDARKRAFAERLEQLPFDQARIPSEVLAKLFAIRKQARTMMEGANQENVHARLAELEKTLDAQKIWAYKFTTMPGSGTDDELERGDEDSIYYMTKDGQTLRIRKASIKDGNGITQIVQPIFEKAFFENKDGDVTEYPQLGYRITELTSKGFTRIQKSILSENTVVTKDFTSPIKTYRRDGKIEGFQTDDPNELEDHLGDRVNHIHFAK